MTLAFDSTLLLEITSLKVLGALCLRIACASITNATVHVQLYEQQEHDYSPGRRFETLAAPIDRLQLGPPWLTIQQDVFKEDGR